MVICNVKRQLLLITVVSFLLASCGGANLRSEAPKGASIPLVTFVFDDGNDTDYLVGKKIFAEQGAVACSAITTDWINTRNHMTLAQIIALQGAGWEIMSHTVSHPNLRSLTPADVDNELSRSKKILEGLGLTIKNIVYPFNKSNEIAREIASKYYRSGRGGTNSFNAGAIDPYYLKSFSTKHDLARMENHIDRAYADKSWLIFYQHEIDVKVNLVDKHGTFTKGEMLSLSPSGTLAKYSTTLWFPVYGYQLYLVPFFGVPQPGDTITGASSGATARIDHIIYNELTQLTEMIGYIHRNYPDMRIVTIDQGLDLMGIPKYEATSKIKNDGMVKGSL